MNYEESVSWLFNQFPAYQNKGISAYKPDLDNVFSLCAIFKVDYYKLKFIHVAGTNGKGSVSNFLASILFENKQKVGLFTSPHIVDFRERIRVNGKMIDESSVIDFCERIQNTEFDVKPSFFEITWVLALIHFLKEECNVCVIETGLGGRLDATNIINPMLSIITNVSLDHTNILGNSIPEIAFEKAGIIKADIPVLIGQSDAENKSVFLQKAKVSDSAIYFAEEMEVGCSFYLKDNYQFNNERTVRCACYILNTLGYDVKTDEISNGFINLFQNTGFLGRYQILLEKPKLIVDAAHNEAGIENLFKSIEKEHFNKLYIIYGASNDKNVENIIAYFPDTSNLNITCFSNTRSLSFSELVTLKASMSRNVNIFENISSALKSIQEVVNEDDIILITGSFFLLSDFFEFFYKNNLQ